MKFITDVDKLQAGLFAVYEARYGAQTAININYIPDLLHHIKRQLTGQQLIRLEDYHLQNYLMELSITYKQTTSLKVLTEIILNHIRSNNNFWYRHNNQEQINEEQQLKHNAISNYHKDIRHLKQAFGTIDHHFPFQPSYKRKTTQALTFQLLHNNIEPHFGTRQPLNYLAYIPSFLIFKYHSHKILNLQNKRQQQIEAEEPQQVLRQQCPEQKAKILQQCIIFLLSNKTEILPNYKQLKDNSDQQQESSEKSQSELQEFLPQKSILEEFLEFVQKEPSLIKFPNSHHLHILTYNLINICKKVYQTSIPHRNVQHKNLESQISPYLKSISLEPQIKESIAMIADRSLSQSQVCLISSHFLDLWESELKFIMNDIRAIQKASIDKNRGWLNSPSQIQRVKQQYQQMLDNPSFVQLTKYRALGAGIPWKDEDYLKFLKGLNQFFNIPTNNKKIAVSMGDGFQPNHVKHVKGVYLTVMKERMDRGQCGGGKRGKCLSKLDFIEKDINNFSIRWFEKAKKIKKRKPKRKRRNSDSEQLQEELDSEY